MFYDFFLMKVFATEGGGYGWKIVLIYISGVGSEPLVINDDVLWVLLYMGRVGSCHFCVMQLG